MRTPLAIALLLLLPVGIGIALHHFLAVNSGGILGFALDWLGRASLAFLFLACLWPLFTRVLIVLPQNSKPQKVALCAAFSLGLAHSVPFLMSMSSRPDELYHNALTWHGSIWLALPVLAVLGALSRRVHQSSAWRKPSSWLLLILALLVAAHAHLLGAMFGSDTGRWFELRIYDLTGSIIEEKTPFGIYFLAGCFASWFVLAILCWRNVRLVSPFPRFSLATLLLLISSSFSLFVVAKFLPPWSIERRLAQPNQHNASRTRNPFFGIEPSDAMAAISQDGRWAASSGSMGFKLWDCTSGEQLSLSAFPKGAVQFARFSPDGRYCISVVRAYAQLSADMPRRILNIHNSSNDPRAMEPAPESDGPRYSNVHVAWFYETESGKLIDSCLAPETSGDVVFSSDSKRVMLNLLHELHLVDLATAQRVALHVFPPADTEGKLPYIRAIGLGGAGLIVPKQVAGFEEFTIATPVFDELKRKVTETELEGVRLSADRQELYARTENYFRSLRISDGIELWRYASEQIDNQPYDLCSFNDNHPVVSGNSSIDFLSLHGERIRSFPINPHPFPANFSRALTEESPVFLDSQQGVYSILDIRRLEFATLFNLNPFSGIPIEANPFTVVHDVAFSSDGNHLLVTSIDGTVDLWKRRHSPGWWGLAEVPEFWLSVALFTALAWSLWRDRKTMWKLAPRDASA